MTVKSYAEGERRVYNEETQTWDRDWESFEVFVEMMRAERTRQEQLYGEYRRDYTYHKYVTVLADQVGKVAQAVNEAVPPPPIDVTEAEGRARAELKDRLKNVAAVAAAMYERIVAEEAGLGAPGGDGQPETE